MAVIGMLGVSLITVIDPKRQFDRAYDTENAEKLRQISQALHSYYQGRGKYPMTTEFPVAGGNFTVGENILMPNVPAQDTNWGPFYFTNNANPQWFAIFWRKRFADTTDAEVGRRSCALERIACVPTGYVNGNYSCLYAGTIDCSFPSGPSLPAIP